MYLKFLINKNGRGTCYSLQERPPIEKGTSSESQLDDDGFTYVVRRLHLINKFDIFQEYEWRLEIVAREILNNQEQIVILIEGE
ncbi:MAG: hypothetical protein IPL46_19910 [Saprospiraceae bacterium]|nr:hypothetical protein [Saprospiraceae bacterium]